MNDVAVPAALIFIDSLGSTLPFKNAFTFKELSDFCHREGINVLAGRDVVEEDLMQIAYIVEGVTNGHVKVAAGPIKSGDRSPLSNVDLQVAHKVAQKECRRCGEPSGSFMLCQGCRDDIEIRHGQVQMAPVSQEPMQLYASATLRDGTEVHVVEVQGSKYVGVDDDFVAHEFEASEVRSYTNMDEALVKLGICTMCGEELTDPKCANCGNE